jgi:serine/threonine protein kinase
VTSDFENTLINRSGRLHSTPDLAILVFMIPDKIGRYEIKAELGRGGMATVYRAYDPRFEREVAVKVLPREMMHDPQFKLRFEREAKTIAMLENSAIVPVYDFGEEAGQPYFVMRYMSGGSLSERIQQSPLTVSEIARILERLAPGLDDAHARGIIHRDLKPGNILYDQRGDPYIADFGIAKLAESGSNVTGSGVIGTPAYMSPEQAKGEAIDGRADIYAMGVILFEALSGQQPYHADTPMGVVVKHITDPVPHILNVNPNLPADIEAVVEKAMAKNKEDRFATAIQFSTALNAVARQENPDYQPATVIARPPVSSNTPTRFDPNQATAISASPLPDMLDATRIAAVRPTPLPKKKSMPWLWIALGIMLCFVLAGGTAFLFRGNLAAIFQPATGTPEIRIASRTSQIVLPTNTPETLPVLETPSVSNSPIQASPSPEPPTLTPESAAPILPVVGGADQVAFINGNNIYTMNVDGSSLKQLTTDGTLKKSLQWMPGGNALIYISGKCIFILDVTSLDNSPLTCFPSAKDLDAFEISPDGNLVAVSLEHDLFVVDFKPGNFKGVDDYSLLLKMPACRTIINSQTVINNKTQPYHVITRLRWSPDSKRIAFAIIGGLGRESIGVLDIFGCDQTKPLPTNFFPEGIFSMDGYEVRPVIPSFDWNDKDLFLLNGSVAKSLYGPLYSYNFDKYLAEKINPINGTCCYLDASWSPDNTYLFFTFRNPAASSEPQFYYLFFGTIGTGIDYKPIPLPSGTLTEPREPVLRPARP